MNRGCCMCCTILLFKYKGYSVVHSYQAVPRSSLTFLAPYIGCLEYKIFIIHHMRGSEEQNAKVLSSVDTSQMCQYFYCQLHFLSSVHTLTLTANCNGFSIKNTRDFLGNCIDIGRTASSKEFRINRISLMLMLAWVGKQQGETQFQVKDKICYCRTLKSWWSDSRWVINWW